MAGTARIVTRTREGLMRRMARKLGHNSTRQSINTIMVSNFTAESSTNVTWATAMCETRGLSSMSLCSEASQAKKICRTSSACIIPNSPLLNSWTVMDLLSSWDTGPFFSESVYMVGILIQLIFIHVSMYHWADI
eukprot:jgi/Bigna1/58942/fgenesh1_kg.2_\